jgi:hypothetical protein
VRRVESLDQVDASTAAGTPIGTETAGHALPLVEILDRWDTGTDRRPVRRIGCPNNWATD